MNVSNLEEQRVKSAVRRFALVCILSSLILGCSTITSRNSSQTVAEGTSVSEEGSGSTDLALEGAGGDRSANWDNSDADPKGDARARLSDISAPRDLVSADSGNIGVSIEQQGNEERITLIPPTGRTRTQTYKLSTLSNPDRVIIDLPATKAQMTRKIPVADSSAVSGIRIGSHDNTTRVVVDLQKKLNGRATAEMNEGVVTVHLPTESVVAAANPIVEPEAIADANTPETVAALPSEESDGLVLNGISLNGGDGSSSSVTAELSGPSTFSLKQTAPSEYVLKVDNASLSRSASGVVIAESAQNPVRSIRPVTQGSDVVLRIFAKPSANLTAKKEGSKIVVLASNPSESEVRAQMKPEAAPAPVVKGSGKADISVKEKTAVASSDTLKFTEGGAPRYTGRLISLDLQDTDIDNALRIIAEVSNLNIIASDDVTGKVTLRLIDVPWDQALDVILKTNNLDKVQEGNVVRIAPVERLRTERESLKQARQAEEELEPLAVKYLRVSYAKASEIKPLLDAVITERGSVAYDERTNQLIVKDIDKGVRNAVQLISKLDLRTPQVLLETQIVEASRSLLRDLGSQFGFRYIESPATGNATGKNFPNSADFNAQIANSAGVNPISLLLGSADGSKSLSATLTQFEREGRARVISRPSVATTNNKPATIKSVTKVRIKLPSGGVSVATGQGASASGQSQVATEAIEVGIVLDVTPQASPDYYVLLDIHAKSSTLGDQVTQEGIPNEIERSATSTVLVSSGQTFGLGGIYKISENDSNSGLPFFKDIPFFGTLFRRVITNGTDEELLFFITPRIVEGSFDDAAMKTSS